MDWFIYKVSTLLPKVPLIYHDFKGAYGGPYNPNFALGGGLSLILDYGCYESYRSKTLDKWETKRYVGLCVTPYGKVGASFRSRMSHL